MDSKELFQLLEEFLLENNFYSQYTSYILDVGRVTLEEWVEWFCTSTLRRNHPEVLMSLFIVPMDIRDKWVETLKNKAF